MGVNLGCKGITPVEGFDQGDYKISIWNAQSLEKVCDIEALEDVSDVKNQSDVEVANIKMCKNAKDLLFAISPTVPLYWVFTFSSQNLDKSIENWIR